MTLLMLYCIVFYSEIPVDVPTTNNGNISQKRKNNKMNEVVV